MSAVNTKSQVLYNEWVNNEYKRMIIHVGERAATVEPGQFFNLLCPQTEQDKPFFRRPMSTYFADPTSGTVEFLYKVVGSGTRTLSQLTKGQQLPVLGPLGKGFTLKDNYQHILIIGRGVGLATLAPLAELATDKKIQITVILSARDRESLMSQSRFLKSGANIIEVIDTDDSSNMDNVEKIIRTTHQYTPFDAVYTCGSTRITKLLQRLVNEFTIEGEVALEQQMACGIGMCYCCVKPFRDQDGIPKNKRVCLDGPVFDIKEVIL